MTVYDPIGHIGAFLIALALAPQVYKTIKTRKTTDISLLWTAILTIGLSVWVVYAVLNLIWPAIIFGSIEFVMAATLLGLKLVYK